MKKQGTIDINIDINIQSITNSNDKLKIKKFITRVRTSTMHTLLIGMENN